MKKFKVLVAALNWGLGHATRCIPVVKALEERDCEVAVASDGASLDLLKEEFPRAKAFELPSYGIKYSAKLPMTVSIAAQLPSIARTIRKETKAVAAIQAAERFDMIISDCRFGCRATGIVTIYMTHQVRIKFPPFMSLFEGIGAALHAQVWKKFDYLWIIDRPGRQGISGRMGQSISDPKTRYIGILSRFIEPQSPPEKTVDICFLLSGPEPHRTMLEKNILGRTWPPDASYVLVRGLPGEIQRPAAPRNWTVENHLSAPALRNLLLSSTSIVCRSGYSTIMDLVRLGLRATLIPTPGQPEQQYLAGIMAEQFGWNTVSQQKIERIGQAPVSLGVTEPYLSRDDKNFLDAAIDEAFETIKNHAGVVTAA